MAEIDPCDPGLRDRLRNVLESAEQSFRLTSLQRLLAIPVEDEQGAVREFLFRVALAIHRTVVHALVSDGISNPPKPLGLHIDCWQDGRSGKFAVSFNVNGARKPALSASRLIVLPLNLFSHGGPSS